MARTTKVVGFTVPSSMAEELEQMAKKEQRTKSELFRAMFRVSRTYRKQIAQAEEERLTEIVQAARSKAKGTS
jgi:metal-responsive CopG/Arc/MetJ family transcriptional regulator